jgi:conjugative transfer signal peptidase TraF
VFIGGLLIAGILLPSKFTVTLTPSLEYRVFFLKRFFAPAEINRGRYVMFSLPDNFADLVNKKNLPAIKQVVGIEGDSLELLGRNFFCNGRPIGKAKQYSLKGERIEHFKESTVIPEGKLFVVGHHKDSLDSKYFGFLDKRDVLAIAYPIF